MKWFFRVSRMRYVCLFIGLLVCVSGAGEGRTAKYFMDYE